MLVVMLGVISVLERKPSDGPCPIHAQVPADESPPRACAGRGTPRTRRTVPLRRRCCWCGPRVG